MRVASQITAAISLAAATAALLVAAGNRHAESSPDAFGDASAQFNQSRVDEKRLTSLKPLKDAEWHAVGDSRDR